MKLIRGLVFVSMILGGSFSHANEKKCFKVRTCDYDFKCDVFHYSTDGQLIGMQEGQPAEQDSPCMTETLAQSPTITPDLAQQARVPANQ
jgi:hypothetical protein